VNVNLRTGVATGVGEIRNIENVFGGAGADKLVGNANTNILKGNGGADNIDGGDGADILLGGAGNDVLTGGLGRDFVFGGQGIDKLYGGGDDDVLVGGTTTLDNKDGALLAMLQQWQREDLDYDQRINLLRNTGVLGGQFKLNAAAVADDGIKDVLTGGGEMDWFWAFGAGNTSDQTDRIHAEQIK
jgi:Ca2+-binding RTX toxin-like protein